MTGRLKKEFSCFVLIILLGSGFLPSLFAQNGRLSQNLGVISPKEWVLLPKEAYVGDQVELRLTIAPGIELLPQDADFVSKEFEAEEVWGSRDFAFRHKLLAQQGNAPMSLHRVSLQRVDEGYSLSLVVTPWVPQEIDVGYFNLFSLPEVQVFAAGTGVQFLLVQLPKIEIASLAQKVGATQLRPVAPPVLVPGSIYVAYGLAIGALLLLIALIFVLARFRQVKLFVKGVMARIRLSRNYKWVLRQLKKLQGQQLKGKELAAGLENITRTYLEGRFGGSFKSAATSEIMFLLDEIFVGMLSDEQLNVVEGLCNLLRRCDYLRYAPAAVLSTGEQAQLISQLKEYIDFMEGKE